MFTKILIANRGEIAVRIIKTCRRLGIGTVGVYSEIDSRSLHIREADEAVYLGPAKSEESYLVKEKIIDAALKTSCQAIHPGYGFLSENPQFAKMVTEAGLIFIGPQASAITAMGDKIASKSLALKLGIPVVPGYPEPLKDLREAISVIGEIGFPLLLKPAAGGGGKGMRIVSSKEEFPQAFKSSQEETRKAFGDDRLFLERFIPNPRHIEMQILADHFGKIIYLGERECSIQRRYQKVIEESPSLALDEPVRKRMGQMACRLASEAGYRNAGTVEFLLDREGNFYFLEMNTRLQVEHPVTEMVTSLDLVEQQLLIAADEPLHLDQDDITTQGWSIEARICAEDPEKGFLPSTGIITRYAISRERNIRVDSGFEAGSAVGVYYDSLLSKVISWGRTREEARETLVQALNGYHIEGVTTNVDFVNTILTHSSFIKGELSTHFIEEHFKQGNPKIAPSMERLSLMIMAATLVYHNRWNLVKESLKPMKAKIGIPHERIMHHQYKVRDEENIFDVQLRQNQEPHQWSIEVNEQQYQVITPEFEFYRRRLKLNINGHHQYFRLQYRGNFIWTAFCGIRRIFEIYSPEEWRLAQYMQKPKEIAKENVLLSPMPGLVVDIKVKSGDRVYQGYDLITIESMKMEAGVPSPCDAEIDEIKVHVGQAVETGDILLTFKS